MIKTLILSGGGIEGASIIGSLGFLYEKDLIKNIDTIWGTSIGSLIGICLCLGYTIGELEKLFMDFDLKLLYNVKHENVLDIFNNYGIDDGKNIEIMVNNIIKFKCGKEDITFMELFNISNITLNINCTCLNTVSTEIFNHTKYPDMIVRDIILVSMKIPLFYYGKKINDLYFCDGFIMNNWCINLIENHENVLGIMITNKINTTEIKSFKDYSIQILKCLYFRNEINILDKYKKYIIEIDNSKYIDNPLDFYIHRDKKEKMYNVGYNMMKKYYKNNKSRF